MKFIVTYKICGKEHKIRITANDKLEAIKKINASLQIIKCEPEEDDTLNELFKIFGMTK
jgi:hypothetical protein